MGRAVGSLLVIGVLVLGACTGGPAPIATVPLGTAAASGGAAPTTGASGPSVSEPAATTAEPTEAPPTEVPPTEAPPTDVPVEPTPGASGPAASSGAPSIDSMTIPHTAVCTSDNGTGTTGMIRISWVASGTTGVRLSIDPPSPDVSYDYPFADYGLTGSVDVPFSCGPSTSDAKGSYHLYVLWTLKVAGHAFYRYAKVYDVTPAP